MTRRRAVALLLLVATSAVACGGVTPDQQPVGTIPAANAAEAPLLPTSADALPTMDPATFGRLLDQLRGTPVLVNFWGSWCPPCRDEMPRLVAAHREFGDRVQFLGVDVLDSRDGAESFMKEFGMTFPSVFDPPDAIKGSLGQFGQPTTVFYRTDGTFAFAWAGPISERVLRRHLAAIVR
jgi:cytochrome c biogenesis protein CcmG/thiol:disulfide interchange protein DsbE